MPDEPEEKSPPPPPDKPRKRRRWLRVVGWTFLALLLLLALFHRPIIFHGTRYFVVRVARQQNLDIDYKMGGSIFTGLRIENLKATPTEPGPVQRLETELVRLEYSLIGFIRDGLPGFLKTVEVRNAFVELTPAERVRKKDKPKQSVKFPALFPERLVLENLNVLIHSPKGDSEIRGLHLTMLPNQPGELRVARLNLPGVHDWSNISATTTYEGRNLMLANLTLGPQIQLRSFNLDASQLDESVLKFGINGRAFSGTVDLTGQIEDLNKDNLLSLRGSLEGLELAKLSAYFSLPTPLTGSLEFLTLEFEGPLPHPNQWNMTARFQGAGFSVGSTVIGDAAAQLAAENGVLKFDLDRLAQGSNVLAGTGTLALPEDFEGFRDPKLDAKINLQAPQLSELKIGDLALGGAVEASGPISLHDGVLKTDVQVKAKDLQVKDVAVRSGEFKLDATRRIIPREEQRAPTPEEEETRAAAKEQRKRRPLQETSVTITGSAEGITAGDITIDSVDADLTLNEEKVTLRNVDIKRGSNVASASGDFVLPQDLKDLSQIKGDAKVKIDAPALREFVENTPGVSIDGSLDVDGTLTRSMDGSMNGNLTLTGRSIRYRELVAEQINSDVAVTNDTATINTLEIIFDAQNRISASGKVGLKEPNPYSGELTATLPNVSFLEPLLRGMDRKEELAGSLTAAWKGEGTRNAHSGEARLELRNGRFGDRRNISANLSGTYTPEVVDFPVVELSADGYRLEAQLVHRDEHLNINNLTLAQNRKTLLYGNITAPFNLRTASKDRPLIPPDGVFSAAVYSNRIDLGIISEFTGEPSPVSGTVTTSITAHGSRSNLVASLSLQGRNIRADAASELRPADIDLGLLLRNEVMELDAEVRQPLIRPITARGKIPVNVDAAEASQIVSRNTPLELDLTLPPSEMNFIAALVPAIRDVRGTAALEVKVRGTVEKPAFSGAATIDMPSMRFQDADIPPIGLFNARLQFTETRLVFDRFGGEMAGGPFQIRGTVDFPTLAEPIFDLRLLADSALLARNDTLIVRANADVQVRGPLKSAAVTGRVMIVDSRFFREIEILPIQLPGRPAPKVRGRGSRRNISFDDPILRGWTFDVVILTPPEEPFLVRGNLANGELIMDLRLTGTGLEPTLDGSIRINDLVASLPFSRLTVETGFAYFTPDQPFVPQLNIRGRSRMRDYNINVFIYGTPENPQTVFSSEPPLPQDEIISLLATGATKEELASGTNVIAGRATLLAAQSLYRRFFGKNQVLTRDDSFLDRFDFDVGTIDPRTGRESVTGRFKLTDRFYLVGDLDVDGNFRGQLKYLLRFR